MRIVFTQDVQMAEGTGVKWTFRKNEGYKCTHKDGCYKIPVNADGERVVIDAPEFMIGKLFYILDDFGNKIVNLPD